jgi:uncharacterized protein YutE (UPF0331/DUF86 family)
VTTGRVNLKVVGDLLQGVDDCLAGLRSLPAGSLEDFTADFRSPAAAESFLRRAIQGLFDVLRHLLAKGYGQGALEYKELARLAAEKGLIHDPALAEVLRKLGGFRNRLTHFYQEVTAAELYGILRDEIGDVEGIVAELRGAAIRVSQT